MEAKALAAGGRGGDDDVLAGHGRFEGSRLMLVELLDPTAAQGVGEGGREAGRERRKGALGGGHGAIGGEAGADVAGGEPGIDDRIEARPASPGRKRHAADTKRMGSTRPALRARAVSRR